MVINKENSYEIARFADGTIRFALSANGLGTDWSWVNTGLTAPLNSWTHLALVKSGTSVSFYLNGSSIFTTTGPATLAANTQPLRIANRVSVGHFFASSIDEVRIWNTGRTQADIKANMYSTNLSNSSANLMAYYKMNDGSGSTASNSSTNTTGINGTLIASPSWTASPIQSGANSLSFDGVNDVVNIPGSSNLNITAAITLEAWVFSTSTSIVQNVVCKSTNAVNTGYIFPRTDDGWNNVTFFLHIGGNWRILAAPFPSRNAWHHVAATYDGSFMRIYVNGVLANSVAQTGTIAVNTSDLVMGNQPGYSEQFTGRVDEVRIWNVARTQTQIASNMSIELNPSTQTNLVSYYKFNQGIASGTNTGIRTLLDYAGNNNGTLSNFAWTGTSSNFLVQPNSISALPVTWKKFSGSFVGSDILLEWSTAFEQNTKSFTVQHSKDGNQWTDLSNIDAAGNSTVGGQYQFVHSNPPVGANYYRIKQFDLDDKFSVSKIIVVQTKKDIPAFRVYPNPVTGRSFTVETTEATDLLIYNSTGHIIVRKSLQAGTHQLQIPTVAPGLYLVSNGKQMIKLVVQ